jgi:two-component system alkaline phosphatase synthesis response regulator PhoP
MNDKKNILVVDDDIDLLEQVAMILQSDGYRITKAQGQKEGEEALLTAVPDLAVLDLMMENMDSGFVLCHHVKRLFPETPVILLTAVKAATGLDFHPGSDDAASWVKADVVLDKPVRPEQLKQEVKRLLKV